MNVSASQIINVSPQEVFEFVANINNERKWRDRTSGARFINGPILEIGTIGESTIENDKAPIKVQWEVFELEQNHFIRWNLLEGPLTGIGGYLVEPAGNGTKLTLEARVSVKGISFLMSPIIYFVAKKMNSNSVSKLKSLLEVQNN